MKRLAIILLMLLVAAACETEKVLFTGPYHVRFTESERMEKESYSQIIKVSVHLVAPSLEEDVSINYSMSGTARENVDFTIVGARGVVTIPKGEYVGYIEVKLINNANNILRSQDVTFTLNSVNNSMLRVGQSEGGIGKKFHLIIQDDCILNGSYLAQRSSTTQQVDITSQDCEQYFLSNWNINLFSFTTSMNLLFTDNGDNTLTIPEQEEENLDEELATIRGTGVVDPLTGAIIFTIVLADFDEQPTVILRLNRN